MFILYAPVRGYPQILPIGLKRSPEAVWLNSNYLLENQEVGFITDTKEFIIGDGKSQFKDLKRYKLVEQKKLIERKRK